MLKRILSAHISALGRSAAVGGAAERRPSAACGAASELVSARFRRIINIVCAGRKKPDDSIKQLASRAAYIVPSMAYGGGNGAT